MATPILMPRPGQMTEECTVSAWLRTEGQAVRKGEVLFEIETDKSTMEIEAFAEGTLLRIDVPVGATAPVNAVVAWIGTPGDPLPPVGTPAPGSAAAPEEAAAAPASPAPAPVPAPAPLVAAPSDAAPRRAISPRAARAAATLGVDPARVTGTGPAGRIVERDILAAAAVAPAEAPATTAEAPRPTVPGELPPEPLGRMRRTIAARLTESVTTIPQFSVSVAVDASALVALRAELRRDGSAVTITDLVHHAVAQSLVELPLVNARTDGRSLWRRERVHLGVAVALPDGLVVPVIRDADRRSPDELHALAAELVGRAREGRLTPDELTGSTFTVSNLGMFGVGSFVAIVNPGESAILAVGSVEPAVVAVGDGMAVRQRMTLTLSADHRIVDGELAARFINAVRRRLEDDAGWRRILAAG